MLHVRRAAPQSCVPSHRITTYAKRPTVRLQRLRSSTIQLHYDCHDCLHAHHHSNLNLSARRRLHFTRSSINTINRCLCPVLRRVEPGPRSGCPVAQGETNDTRKRSKADHITRIFRQARRLDGLRCVVCLCNSSHNRSWYINSKSSRGRVAPSKTLTAIVIITEQRQTHTARTTTPPVSSKSERHTH